MLACKYLGISFIDYVIKLKPFVKHIHISDGKGVEGEGTQIGTGEIDFRAFFDAYKDYEGTWIPEIWQGHINNHKGAKEALLTLSEIFGTDKLGQKA